MDPDNNWEEMQSAFLKVAENLCTQTSFKIKKDKPPYLISTISKEMGYRDKLFCRTRQKLGE